MKSALLLFFSPFLGFSLSKVVFAVAAASRRLRGRQRSVLLHAVGGSEGFLSVCGLLALHALLRVLVHSVAVALSRA